jgi:hypothetical protein
MRPNLARKALRSLAAIGLLAVVGCSTSNPLRLGNSAQSLPFTSSKEATTQFRALATPAMLTRVDSASAPGFDRLVFTFSGKRLPGYWFLSQNAKPGAPAIFEMRFGARGTRANGKPSIATKYQRRSLSYPVLKGVAQAKVGEESTLWEADLAKESDYRVSELSNPPRIILDFKH